MIPGAAYSETTVQGLLWPSLNPAVRLGGLILMLATCLAMPLPGLLILLGLASWLLVKTGLPLVSQLKSLKPWLLMGLFIVAIHVFSTTAAAPLGHPTWAGARAGAHALMRVGSTVAWLGIFIRTTSLDDLVAAVQWWLQPMQRLGFPSEDLGLMLAVAMGTTPVVMSEGRRIEASLRLRRCGARDKDRPKPRSWQALFTRWQDRTRVIVPLLEAMARRAEALSLSLRSRRPGQGALTMVRPSLAEMTFLLIWLAALVLVLNIPRGGA